VPTNLTATAVSVTQINLTWTAATDNVGVAGYKVFRDGGATPIATVTVTSFSDVGLAPSTTHTYTVVAFDAAGNQSAPSATAFATTPADTTPPTAPTNLKGTAVSTSQINLTWTAATDNVGVAGYHVFRDGGATPIAAVIGTSFSDTGLATGSTHTYTVSAFDAAGNESAQSAAASATTQAPVARLSPASLTFGTVARGVTSAAQGVTLTNSGTAVLTIASIAIGGANPTDFVIAAKTCGATLAPAASCTVNVAFRPTARNARSGTLSITDNAAGSPQSVALTGTGL
jgi:chitodextrinase